VLSCPKNYFCPPRLPNPHRNLILPAPYRLQQSRAWQGGILLRFLQAAYGELTPQTELGHLGRMVEHFYQPETTPLWILSDGSAPLGCLWLGSALDQTTGGGVAYIFLVYIHPVHRRRGLATYLLTKAAEWAKSQGFSQLNLQVLAESAAAQALYAKVGFLPRAYLLSRPLL